MHIDGRKISDGSLLEADVIVIGGGFAGVTIALELAKSNITVIVLESGGHEPDNETQDLYRGETTGLQYQYADGARSRYLGGSSNCWAGWCRPFDEMDFKKRPWIQGSGWPIELSEIERFYRRTHHYLELGPYHYETDRFVSAIDRQNVRRIPFSSGDVEDSLSQFSPPTRIAKTFARDLTESTGIRVVCHANVVNFEIRPGSDNVRFVHCQTLSGVSFMATGKVFCLATGGIENARLMLASNRTRPAGIGNENDLVGRYFMDHPRVRSGVIKPIGKWKSNLLYDAKFNLQNPVVNAWGTNVAAAFRLTRETQRREQVTDALVWMMSEFHGENSDAYNALVRLRHRKIYKEKLAVPLVDDLKTVALNPLDAGIYAIARKARRHSLVRTIRLHAIAEPEPNPDSRVQLSDTRKDALGMPRVNVTWGLTDLVRHTFDRNFAIIANELQQSNVASVTLDKPLLGQASWPASFEERGTWHHMGTTRMHDDPKNGVVDSNCRVHSVSNLYVAGSSVFTTGGANYPTQTLIALAIRLAEHLKEQLQEAPAQVRATHRDKTQDLDSTN